LKDVILDPVAYVLQSLSFKVVGVNGEWENGVAFGLKNDECINRVEGSLLPSIRQDWELINDRVAPLVKNVLKIVENKT
jgi:hypothetical protein